MAVASVASWAVPAVMSYIGSKQQNSANQSMSERQMLWEDQMSSTAYQRATADMKAAGLNPMLAYSQGGASTPGVSMPVMNNVLGQAASSGSEGAQAYAAVKQMNAQTDTTKSQAVLNSALAAKASADAKLSITAAAEAAARTGIYQPQVQEILARIDKIAIDNRLTGAQTALVKQEALNAVSKGENIRADTGNKYVDNQILGLNRLLLNLQVPGERAKSNLASSPWGQYVSPLLHDIGSMAGSARDVGIATRGPTIINQQRGKK